MVSGQPPWFDAKVSTPVALLQAMLQRHGQPPPFPEGLSASLTKFLERCFRWDPARRPSAAKLLHEVSSFLLLLLSVLVLLVVLLLVLLLSNAVALLLLACAVVCIIVYFCVGAPCSCGSKCAHCDQCMRSSLCAHQLCCGTQPFLLETDEEDQQLQLAQQAQQAQQHHAWTISGGWGSRRASATQALDDSGSAAYSAADADTDVSMNMIRAASMRTRAKSYSNFNDALLPFRTGSNLQGGRAAAATAAAAVAGGGSASLGAEQTGLERPPLHTGSSGLRSSDARLDLVLRASTSPDISQTRQQQRLAAVTQQRLPRKASAPVMLEPLPATQSSLHAAHQQQKQQQQQQQQHHSPRQTHQQQQQQHRSPRQQHEEQQPSAPSVAQSLSPLRWQAYAQTCPQQLAATPRGQQQQQQHQQQQPQQQLVQQHKQRVQQQQQQQSAAYASDNAAEEQATTAQLQHLQQSVNDMQAQWQHMSPPSEWPEWAQKGFQSRVAQQEQRSATGTPLQRKQLQSMMTQMGHMLDNSDHSTAGSTRTSTPMSSEGTTNSGASAAGAAGAGSASAAGAAGCSMGTPPRRAVTIAVVAPAAAAHNPFSGKACAVLSDTVACQQAA
jgi:hypothetical protein